MTTTDFLKLKLQFFGDSNDNQDDNQGNNQDGSENGDNQQVKTYTEDEFNQKLQSELTRRLKQKEEEKKKEIEEAKRLAKLSKDEKKDYELDKLKKQIAGLNKEKSLSDMKDVARDILNDKGVSATSELLNLVVTTDAETTISNVDTFVAVLNAAVEKKVNEALKQSVPKSTTGSNGLTKKDILVKSDYINSKVIERALRMLYNLGEIKYKVR